MVPDTFFNAMQQFLTALERVQKELEEVLEEKRSALLNGKPEVLLPLVEREKYTAERMSRLAEIRDKLLLAARQQSLPSDSLESLAKRGNTPAWREMQNRIIANRERMTKIRQEAWTQWIVTQRCSRHYSELKDWIAEHGQPPATYHPTSPFQCGGSLLDTSA